MKPEGRRPRVLICDLIDEVGIKMLREHANVDVKTGLSPAELLTVVGDYEVVVTRSATKITAEVIEHGLRLKVIGRAGAGLDNIDVVAAQNREIKVVNCPDANTLAVAEHTMALLLALARGLPRADLSLKKGQWEKSKFMGTGLSGKTLGIIGFGRIGREVAARAQAFGMKVIVNQRRPTPELNLEAGVESVDLMELLKASDFVTLHIPSKAETKNLIDAEQLAVMKPTAYLINTARGTVVAEAALLEALNNGQIAGAALDVFAEEPAINNALAQHERVIATPHIAASTEDAQRAAAITVAEKIIQLIREVRSESLLGLQVVPMDKVFPHERVDTRRVEKLARRLEVEGKLTNPPVVAEAGDRYVVLDGATRTAALKQLGYPHVIVQVASAKDQLGLHTWLHAIRQANVAQLVKLLDDLPEISLVETSAGKILDDMIEHGGLCYLHTIEGKVFLIQSTQGTSRLNALNKLTEAYMKAYQVSRTLNKNIISLHQEFPDLTALVVFPEYTVEQVLQIAQAGRELPAGITRFIIPGRVLRLNAELRHLKSDQSLNEKNEWLHQLLMDKLDQGKIRYYQEPVYLLDE
jgi:phosphoglycerate dehydrogenase-like enzyme/DTW domain-containing protein YfiP